MRYAEKRERILTWLHRIFLIILWVAIIALCVIFRDEISVSGILKYSPSNPWLAAAVLLLLFAFKSLSIVIHCGILYTASGIMFPLPAAIVLNICGTAIMVTLPYIIGRKSGSAIVERITEKYPKVNKIKKIREKNDFIFTFLVRYIGLVPCDVVSLYMGAIGVGYPKYLLGCLAGMLPPIILFPLMGTSITDPASPIFIISVITEVLVILSAPLIYKISCRIHSEKRRH